METLLKNPAKKKWDIPKMRKLAKEIKELTAYEKKKYWKNEETYDERICREDTE